MKELIGADIAPAILADKIRDLQEEWKTLSTTGTGNDRDLWESFNQAADKAFEPCKAYFAEQTKLRDSYVELRSEEHTSELQSRPHLVCRLLLEKKKQKKIRIKTNM